jgi:DNA-binding XRE family transcriptional regulator
MKSRLQQYKEDCGATDIALSTRIGVSRQQVNHWSIYGIQNWATAERVAKRLNCDPIEIIGVTRGMGTWN